MPRLLPAALLALSLAPIACANAMNDPAIDAVPAPDATPDQALPDPPKPALWLLVNDTAAATNELYRVEPLTFAVQGHVDLHYAGALWELAGSTSTRAYAIDRDLDLLVAIDLEAGAITSTVHLAGDMKQNGRGFGIAPDGTLWGIFSGSLAQIDPGTGALSHSVTLQYGLAAESLDTCGGQLYMASRESGSPRGEKLYAVDRAAGTAMLRGMIGTTAIDIDTLACSSGALYGLDTDPTIGKMLYRIDTATGGATVANQLAVIGDVNGVHATPPPELVIE